MKFSVGPETNTQQSKLTNLDKDHKCSSGESEPQVYYTDPAL
uniref:Uncharacterized protein n=1 Tax=Anguilla anguilla TaxID=7936 RepID=A0A0E9PR17_ANGAN